MSDIMILVQAVLQLFCHKVALLYKMQKSEKGDNAVKYLQKFAKIQSGHLHLGHNLCVKYHDPYSSGSPDTFFSQCTLWIKYLSMKREIIQSNIHRVLQKVNKVIYTIYPN